MSATARRSAAAEAAAVSVTGLRVETGGGAAIVDGISLRVEPSGILGLVGESGSGKTTVARALLGFAGRGTRIAAGSVQVAGEEVLGRSERELRRLRGRLVSYVPQDPATSLNPSMRVAAHLAEILREHRPEADARTEIPSLLERVSLPASHDFQRRFPHQLSGGQQQRLAIAVALAGNPRLVVLDEPTTGLDVVTQARILEELDRLRRELQVGMVYVSHDLAVVAQLADRVAVMYAGALVEEGSAADVFAAPRHPYTAGLVASIPDHLAPRVLHGIPGVAVGVFDRPGGCPFAPRCSQRVPDCELAMPPLEAVGDGTVRCLQWQRTPAQVGRADPATVRGMREGGYAPLLAIEGLTILYQTRLGTVVAARDVSLQIGTGEAVALVGESGSGKTSVARCVAGLVQPAAGTVALDGRALAGRARSRGVDERRRIQIVFQNPTDSLNPRRRVLDAVARPAVLLQGMSRRAAEVEAMRLLERVRLPARIADRLPLELSGGERQRVAIARALAAGPALLVCDEVTSALDVSVQASVLELLAELRAELGLALLFISHDLGVVASVCDRVLVLRDGTVREQGRVDRLLSSPTDDYTRLLIDSAPRLVPSHG